VKKLVGLAAAAFAVPAAIGAIALYSPPVAVSQPANYAGLNVVGEPYGRALQILKSQGVKASFGGSFGSDLPQSMCIVDQQKVISTGKMILMLNCTQAAADHATDSTPAQPAAPSGAPGAAPGAPAPGAGQGTYGGPIGVPVPVG
jgi:hypothetical protein